MHRRTLFAATVAVAAPGVGGGDLVRALHPTSARSTPTSAYDGPWLASRATTARRLLCTCRYGELNATLPTPIGDLRHAQSTGGTTVDLAGLLAIAYQTAASLMLKLGRERQRLAGRGPRDRGSGDPVVMASCDRFLYVVSRTW